MPTDSWSLLGAFWRLERCGKSYTNTCQVFHLKMVAGLSHGKAKNLLREVPKAPYRSQPGDLGKGQVQASAKGHKAPWPPGQSCSAAFFKFCFIFALFVHSGDYKNLSKARQGAELSAPRLRKATRGGVHGQGCTPDLHGLLPFPSASVLNAGVNSPCWCVGPTALLHL